MKSFLALLFCTALTLGTAAQADDELRITTDNEQDLHVRVYANASDTPILIWLEELSDTRPGFEALMLDLQAKGFTVWRENLLEDFFLERSPSTVRGLDGKGVLALLRAAEQSRRPYLLVAADRMVIPALRGARRWQAEMPAGHHFRGVAMIYPNLFGPAPPAGVEPELMPIVTRSSVPVYVLQPERGALRARLSAMTDGLRRGGAPTYVRLVRNVRDWYFMHDPGSDPDEATAVAAMPAQLHEAIRLLAPFAAGMPRAADTALPEPSRTRATRGLIEIPGHPSAPPYRLQATRGGEQSLADIRGKVALVNFWASWCAPCVHEIPSMNRLAAKFGGDDFTIVSINFREDPQHIQDFMQKVQVDFPVLLDPDGRTAENWRVFAFPSSFLLDRAGRIRYSVNSAIEWDSDEPGVVIEGLIREPR